MSDLTAVKYRYTKNQRIIKYYNDLKSESGTKVVTVTWLRILTQSALRQFRSIVGIGVGIGFTHFKPSKAMSLQYCTINSTLTSVECSPILPTWYLQNPLLPCFSDGIELHHHEQNSTLCCHVRFSRLRITAPEVATSSLHAANVVPDNPGAHVGAWFNYDNNTFAVQSIANGFCYCNSVEVEGITIELPLDLVYNLVSSFGS